MSKALWIIVLLVAALAIYNWWVNRTTLPDGRTPTNIVGPLPS